MTYVFGGTPEDQIRAFFDHLERARQGGPQANLEFREALACFVGLLDRQSAGGLATERLEQFWRDACEALIGLAGEVAAYVHVTLIIAEGANDNEWYELCLRRSVIQLLLDHCPFVAGAIQQADLSLSEIDAELRRLGPDLGPVQDRYKPKGLPDGHWWWHYPHPAGDATT